MEKRKTKKIILFIVEGQSDQESLELLLEEYLKNYQVKFKVVRGDITTQEHLTPDHAIRKIKLCIDEIVNGRIIKKDDIEKVIHLIDMDGVFIPNSMIQYDPKAASIQYYEDSIVSNNVEMVQRRNDEKRRVIRKLIETKNINKTEYGKSRKIPYEIYYFSCNIEHVLHNDKNASDSEKMRSAHHFVDQYIDQNDAFISFLCESDFSVNMSFKESWNYIMQNDHSLKRHSNLCIFIKDYQE